MEKNPVIIAHSGFENTNPNTFLSIYRTVELDLDFLEIDLQYNNNTVYLSNHRLEGDDLVDAPTFYEALVFAEKNNIQYSLNLKNPEGLNPSLQLLKETNMLSNVIFTEGIYPNVTAICEFKYLLNVDNLQRFPYINKHSAKELIEYYSVIGDKRCIGFSVNNFFISRAAVKEILDSNIKLSLWTVDLTRRLKSYQSLGVDYIITSRPVFAKSLEK